MPENPPTNKEHKAAIHWFRHGLRLHDNPALLEAISCAKEVYPIFIFDGEVAGTRTAGYNRMRFLRESLDDLDKNLKKHGGRLYVFRGNPVEIISNLIKEWDVGCVTFEQDPEPIWEDRDEAVKKMCTANGITLVEKISHNLWDPKEVIENNGGSPPLTYMLFNQVTSAIGDPPRPASDPDFSSVKLPVATDHDNKYSLPTLESLGVQPECKQQTERVNNWKGGETHALELFTNRVKVESMAHTCGTVMPNQAFPDLVGPPLSMSAHLRFGCLSIRKLYWALRESFEKHGGNKPFSVSVVGQLIWREYFYTMSVKNKNYNTMEKNPICLNIPWYTHEEHLKRWTEGRTGYPWIDAIMTQLLHEGWIHHVARNAVATFLTRGDLWLNWEDGLAVFDKYLLDADWSVCAGNWMWVSSSAFEMVLQCPKCFCPVRYGRKVDPSGEYVRRYLPVLKDMPLRYLFEPWKAPRAVQEKAKCIIGEDYPSPIVDHAKASKECHNRMTEVKNILRASGKEHKHCGPANLEEISSFFWIPGAHAGDNRHNNVNTEHLCNGLNEL